jgi:hypothetical protein
MRQNPISYGGTAQIDGNYNRGSCFYKEDARQQYSILSTVNPEKLYTKKTTGYLNLNIKVKQAGLAEVSDVDLLSIIRTELQSCFKDVCGFGAGEQDRLGKGHAHCH